MSLKCDVDLGIPDIIHNHGKPMTVSDLVAALPTLNSTKARNLYRLMRILLHSVFFDQQKLSNGVQEDGSVLTNASHSGNLKYVGGDMFEDVPVADAVLLKER
ncbi:hypothetical protein GQ457_14G022000 [Hibiscus cannabinus]